ncbi:hypothetical protein [Clostridium sp. MD294]|uniref:hypothetical protein n=1 Tax=Clostridium sp. MD294 TaxID=97138 RepID=UPI0002CA30A6|nr:hypothetical protein [Clostridium sp. MD294]NDO46169.1 hypothetical protein [Clostridium sp. MD294]USF30165.1 hypothetical protein C820_001606 [Clostridium sp. MD294]
MKSNKWNMILAVSNLLISVLFIVKMQMPEETISKKFSGIVAFVYMISAIVYFCIYIQNKKYIEKDKC